MLEQEGAFLDCFHDVGSMKRSKLSWYAEALGVPFSRNKGHGKSS